MAIEFGSRRETFETVSYTHLAEIVLAHLLVVAVDQAAVSVHVTVVCDSSTTADALSTALFVMGSEAGLAFAQTMEGVDVLMIDQNSNVITTPDFIEKYNFKRS